MTTAARPTFDSARGLRQDKSAAQSRQVRARDLVVSDLKVRKPGQSTRDEVNETDLKEKLENDEQRAKRRNKPLPSTFLEKFGDIQNFDADRDDDLTEQNEQNEKDLNDSFQKHSDNSATEDSADHDVDHLESVSSEDDLSDDEEAELIQELNQIKKEREEEKFLEEQRQLEKIEKEKEERALHGNPLLAPSQGFQVKRRWDEDVVFKNQAKGVDEKPKKRFINDVIRSDFHKKFLERYVR